MSRKTKPKKTQPTFEYPVPKILPYVIRMMLKGRYWEDKQLRDRIPDPT